MAVTDATTIRKLEFSGTVDEIGAAHGEECREEINTLYEIRQGIILAEIKGLSEGRLESVCSSLWAYVATRCPEVCAEVAATATSARLKPWQLIVAGAYTDVLDVCREAKQSGRDECTVGISVASRFIAGTWDTHASAGDALILLARRPTRGPATLALTTAGWPAQQGVNSAGLAFAITNLTPRTARCIGLPYIAANALLASSLSVEEFVERVGKERFASGHAYLAVAADGTGVIVETSDRRVEVCRVADDAVKANHYRPSSTLDDNAAYQYLEGSCTREAEFSALMKDMHGPASFAQALAASRSINRTDAAGAAVTCAHFFLDASKAELWYARGPGGGERLKMARLD